MLDFKDSWDKYLRLIEFAYNNSYHSTIGMAPYEALYERKYRSPLYWTEIDDKHLEGPKLIRMTSEAVSLIQARLMIAFSK